MKESSVASFLKDAIESSKKTQKEIALEAGFLKPNIITMIKQGLTKMPITKVKPMAEALNMDPMILLEKCFEEYQPGNWAAIQEIFKDKGTEHKVQ